ERAGLDPTFVIGGDLNESGSNARHGAGDWFVAEADESDGSFLLLEPEVAIVTNVEQDHVDFYRSREETREAFAQFVRSAGVVIACADDEGVRDVLGRAGRDGRTRTYGLGSEADVRVTTTGSSGRSISGVVELDGGPVEVTLRVPGVHNLLNAAAALLAAREA